MHRDVYKSFADIELPYWGLDEGLFFYFIDALGKLYERYLLLFYKSLGRHVGSPAKPTAVSEMGDRLRILRMSIC